MLYVCPEELGGSSPTAISSRGVGDDPNYTVGCARARVQVARSSAPQETGIRILNEGDWVQINPPVVE